MDVDQWTPGAGNRRDCGRRHSVHEGEGLKVLVSWMALWIGVPILLVVAVAIGFFLSARRKGRKPHERREIPPPP